LQSGWIFSWPEVGDAPFMEEVALLASEEFDALVFNALHGWYRQSLGCLRNAVEILMITTAFSIRNDATKFAEWRAGTRAVKLGHAREMIRDSARSTRSLHSLS